jgi:hypothetical protein
MPRAEWDYFPTLSVARRFGTQTMRVAADELTKRDPFTTDVDFDLGTGSGVLSEPWQGAIALAIASPLGAVLPILAILLLPNGCRVFVPFGAVFVLALARAMSAVLERHRRGFVSGTVGLESRVTPSTGTPARQSGLSPVKFESRGSEEAKTIAGEKIPDIKTSSSVVVSMCRPAKGLSSTMPCELSLRCG